MGKVLQFKKRLSRKYDLPQAMIQILSFARIELNCLELEVLQNSFNVLKQKIFKHEHNILQSEIIELYDETCDYKVGLIEYVTKTILKDPKTPSILKQLYNDFSQKGEKYKHFNFNFEKYVLYYWCLFIWFYIPIPNQKKPFKLM